MLQWAACIAGFAAVAPLMLIAFGEHGAGPANAREWAYLVLFPFGFSAGYLIAWRWPLAGGCAALACMAASLVVIGRTYDLAAYLVWGAVCVPGVFMVLAGLMLRRAAGPGTAPPAPRAPAHMA